METPFVHSIVHATTMTEAPDLFNTELYDQCMALTGRLISVFNAKGKNKLSRYQYSVPQINHTQSIQVQLFKFYTDTQNPKL